MYVSRWHSHPQHLTICGLPDMALEKPIYAHLGSIWAAVYYGLPRGATGILPPEVASFQTPAIWARFTRHFVNGRRLLLLVGVGLFDQPKNACSFRKRVLL